MGIRRSNRGGENPLSYIGVAPDSTPAFFEVDRAPTTRDYSGYNLGDFWLDRKTDDVWVLVSLEKNVGTGAKEAAWVKFATGATTLRKFITDVGTVVPSVGGVNVFGFGGITTSGAGNTVTIELGESALDGQLFIGGGIAPTLGYITSTGGTLLITNASNSITIASAPGGDMLTIGTDGGIAVPGSGGTVNLTGTTNINTSGAGAIATVSLKNDVTLSTGLTLSALGAGVMQTDGAGVVTSTNGTDGQLLIDSTAGAPAWANITSTGVTVSVNNLPNSIELEIAATGTLQRLGADIGPGAVTVTGTVNVLGSTNINTVGAGSTTTINLDNSIDLGSGLTLSASGAGVLQNSGAGVVSSSNGTNGQVLISSSSGAPAWANITSTTLTVTDGPGTINIEKDSSSSPCPPFLYVLSVAGGAGVLGGAGYYYLGDDIILTKRFDDGSNVYPGDGAGAHAYFEAPVTGKYLINLNVILSGTPGSTTPDIRFEIETTARLYSHLLNAVVPSSAFIPVFSFSRSFSVVCDMAITDKAYFKILANTGSAITASGGVAVSTCISGFLVET